MAPIEMPPTAARSFARRAIGRLRRVAFGTLGRTAFGTITSVETDQPLVSITFDGGPDAVWTPQVLDVLDAHGAKATFFVIGKYVDLHPDIVGRIHAAGHALGNHTYDHPSFPLVSAAERRRELQRCAATLKPFPQRRRLFRPPYLDQSFASRYDAWRSGYEVVTCNRHANDWEDRTSDEMTQVLNGTIEAGDVVMLHDAVCDQRYRSRTAMIETLDAVLRHLTPRFRFVTLPDLLEAGRPRREMWIKRPNVVRLSSYERVF